MKNHGTCPRAKRHQRDCAKVAWRAEKQKLKLERRKAKRNMSIYEVIIKAIQSVIGDEL